MIRSVEWEDRLRLKEASPKLAEPLRDLAQAALDRARKDGTTDSLRRRQLALQDEIEGVGYNITVLGENEPTESLHGTVFIDGKRRDESDPEFSLQIPDPTQGPYRPAEIFHLRGILPESIPPVAEKIKTAPVRPSGVRRR